MDALTVVLAIALSIGLTQGVVFAVILWRKSSTDWVANRYKSLLLLVLSYGLLNQVLRLFGIGYYDTWYPLTLDLSWSYGPLLYLYVKAQAVPEYRFTRKDLWVLSPIFLQIIFSIYVRSQNFYWDGTRESLSWLGYWGYVYWRNYSTEPIIASILIFVFSYLSLQLLRELKKEDVDKKNLQWVQNLVRSFGIYYIVVLVILVVDLTVYVTTVDRDYFYFTRFYYYPFFIGMAIIIYWFGISSIIRSDQRVLKARKKLSESERQALEAIAKQLDELMVMAKLYMDSELTLASLAEQLSVKPYLLTKTLNEVIHKSFTDFVNEFRVEEVNRLVNEPGNEKYTLLSLAYDAGFNSKSSFNRAVKKHLDISPSQLKNNR